MGKKGLKKKRISDLVVLVSTGTVDEAAKIAKNIVDLHLAACANIIPKMRSIYRWNGKTEDSTEALIIFKTTALCYKRLEHTVKEQHHYSVPEIIGFPITYGSSQYRKWIKEQTLE